MPVVYGAGARSRCRPCLASLQQGGARREGGGTASNAPRAPSHREAARSMSSATNSRDPAHTHKLWARQGVHWIDGLEEETREHETKSLALTRLTSGQHWAPRGMATFSPDWLSCAFLLKAASVGSPSVETPLLNSTTSLARKSVWQRPGVQPTRCALGSSPRKCLHIWHARALRPSGEQCVRRSNAEGNCCPCPPGNVATTPHPDAQDFARAPNAL